jgi:release factor glutamine methyltransferase
MTDVITRSAEKLLDNATVRLRTAGVDSPRLEGRLLLAHAMNARQEDILVGRMPDPTALQRFEAILRRREKREPLAYILGKREFWSLDFAVGPGVLIPRPESETLIEAALADFPDSCPPLRVLDIGTGSGCLLIAFLKERPQGTGIGVDISSEALAWAERNFGAHNLANRVSLIHGSASQAEGEFDVILCNPPYVADAAFESLEPEITHHEPAMALKAGKDGLDAYRQLAPQMRQRLRPGARAYVEVGQGQATDVMEIFTTRGLSVVRVVDDLAKVPRCVVAALSG